MPPADDSENRVCIELHGISAYGHHGVTEAEREVGQRIEIDLIIELANPEATRTLGGFDRTGPRGRSLCRDGRGAVNSARASASAATLMPTAAHARARAGRPRRDRTRRRRATR